ncbi:MAG: ATP-binding protein [Nitrospirae bacterium]|nr:ATP-binding protein [Nitrospirota bacterium]
MPDYNIGKESDVSRLLTCISDCNIIQIVNDNYSTREFIYKKRLITPQIKSAVEAFPIVVISGARQVGKSTLLQNEFTDFKYISLDDFSILQQAKTDPASLWVDTDRIIIDEAQKSPELISAIKLVVDRSHRRKHFILSGSSNMLLMKRISETLAGRAVYFEMLPMTYSEMENKTDAPLRFFDLWEEAFKAAELQATPINTAALILKGFMPPLIHLADRRDILLWWEGYVKTYLERDVRELTQVESLIDFKKVLDSLAVRTGNVLNQTEVSRDSGVSQPTVHRYVKLLEVSNIINRIPSYYRNRTKRITKSPKLFFIDAGLSVYLAGYYDEDSLLHSRERGSFFETMVYMHLKAASELMVPKAKIFYWRTTTGKEVDFVLEHGKRLLAFEVKLTQNPTFNDAKNLLAFIEEYPQTTRGILLHSGNVVKWLHSKILSAPWWWVWE